MGRNLYILAATLTLFSVMSCGLAYTNIAQQPGSPGDAALWRTTGLGLFVLGLVIALAGILSSLFEQAERRTEEPPPPQPAPPPAARTARIVTQKGTTRMFEVTVEAGFSSGHYLRNYRGKCENPHGHNYKVFITLIGAELDPRPASSSTSSCSNKSCAPPSTTSTTA